MHIYIYTHTHTRSRARPDRMPQRVASAVVACRPKIAVYGCVTLLQFNHVYSYDKTTNVTHRNMICYKIACYCITPHHVMSYRATSCHACRTSL